MKTTLTISLCFMSLLSFGQIGKGAVSLSGTAGYSGSQDSGVPIVGSGTARPDFGFTKYSINIRPAVGYFISDKGQLILQGIYEFTYSDTYITKSQQSNELGALVGYQHFINVSDRFYFAPIFFASMSNTKKDFQEPEDDPLSLKHFTFEGGMKPYLFYSLSDKWLVGLSLGKVAYQRIRGEEYQIDLGGSAKQKQDKINIGMDFSDVQLTIQFLLTKSKKEDG